MDHARGWRGAELSEYVRGEIMAKFEALADHCREQKLKEFELAFHRIEAIIGSKLPDSALRPNIGLTSSTEPGRSGQR